jgi:hypothetical protein
VISDTEGHFTIGGLARDARCTVRGEQPHGAVGLKRDARPGDDVVISLPALGTLSGTALTANGDFVERFAVSLRDEQTGQTRREMVAAPGGRWSLAKVQPGALQINADVEGTVAQARADLAPGQVLAEVRLEFRSLREARAPNAPGLRSP